MFGPTDRTVILDEVTRPPETTVDPVRSSHTHRHSSGTIEKERVSSVKNREIPSFYNRV